MKVKDAAKYLGFFVGPGTEDKDWERVLGMLKSASRAIREAGLPRLKCFQSFLAYGVSHLIFISQLRRPPASILKLELQNIRDSIRGPGLWAPAKLFYYLKELGLFHCALRACQPLCRACMLRTTIQIGSDLRLVHHRFNDPQQLDGNDHFVFPFPHWRSRLALVNFHAVSTEFDQGFKSGKTCLHGVALQKTLFSFLLHRQLPFNFELFFQDKLAHWTCRESVPMLGEIALKCMQILATVVPPCVMF